MLQNPLVNIMTAGTRKTKRDDVSVGKVNVAVAADAWWKKGMLVWQKLMNLCIAKNKESMKKLRESGK